MRIYWNNNSNHYFGQLFGNAGQAADNRLQTDEFLILYITIAPGNDQQLPVLHHEYAFVNAVFNYRLNSGSY